MRKLPLAVVRLGRAITTWAAWRPGVLFNKVAVLAVSPPWFGNPLGAPGQLDSRPTVFDTSVKPCITVLSRRSIPDLASFNEDKFYPDSWPRNGWTLSSCSVRQQVKPPVSNLNVAWETFDPYLVQRLPFLLQIVRWSVPTLLHNDSNLPCLPLPTLYLFWFPTTPKIKDRSSKHNLALEIKIFRLVLEQDAPESTDDVC